MASALYPSFKQLALGGDIDLITDDIRVAALGSGYTFSSAHDFRDDLGANVIALSGALSSKSITSGVFDAADGLFASVASGSTIVAVALYKHTGTITTDPLIVFIDGLNLATNGNNVNIVWNVNGIFAL